MSRILDPVALFRAVRAFPSLDQLGPKFGRLSPEYLEARLPGNPSARRAFAMGVPADLEGDDLIAALVFAEMLDVISLADQVMGLTGRQHFPALLELRFDDRLSGGRADRAALITHLAAADTRFR